MEFKDFRKAIQDHFEKMVADVNTLFEVEVDKDEMWNTYLDSYPTGTNLIYRKRREYDCSCCRQFIKAMIGKFGKTVFLTREEAEKALKEMEEDDAAN